jgi:hypothetical protein
MKIGHLLMGLAGLPYALAFLSGEISVVSSLVLPLALLAVLAVRYDVMVRSAGEALFSRPGDAEADEALHRALVACSWDDRRRARANVSGRARAGHRCPLRRRARRPGLRGPVRVAT